MVARHPTRGVFIILPNDFYLQSQPDGGWISSDYKAWIEMSPTAAKMKKRFKDAGWKVLHAED